MTTHPSLVTLIVAALSACSDPPPEQVESPSDAQVSAALASDLQFLREEEKLARDVYLTLYETWQLRPHERISSSEQTHMDRVKDTLAALSIADPVTDDGVGVFANEQLATLYRELVAEGETSATAALQVGATIEDLDLHDIDMMKTRTSDPTVLAMYDALHCGSRNHLRAFTSQLAMRGVTYAPRHISVAQYETILAGEQESCGR